MEDRCRAGGGVRTGGGTCRAVEPHSAWVMSSSHAPTISIAAHTPLASAHTGARLAVRSVEPVEGGEGDRHGGVVVEARALGGASSRVVVAEHRPHGRLDRGEALRVGAEDLVA